MFYNVNARLVFALFCCLMSVSHGCLGFVLFPKRFPVEIHMFLNDLKT